MPSKGGKKTANKNKINIVIINPSIPTIYNNFKRRRYVYIPRIL